MFPQAYSLSKDIVVKALCSTNRAAMRILCVNRCDGCIIRPLTMHVDHLPTQAELEHEAAVTCLCHCRDVSTLVAATRDGAVCVWDVTSQYMLNTFQVHDGSVHCVQLTQGQ